MYLSKSKYCTGITCKKRLWLEENKPEEKEEVNDSVLLNGTKVGEIAKNLFGPFIDVKFSDNLSTMINDTKSLLNIKNIVITEASFNYDNNFCSVDILKKDDDKYEMYEVKSSTEISDIYIDDISYQYYILKNLGYNVVKASIVYINKNYIKNGELNLKELFNIEDVTEKVIENYNKVKENILDIKENIGEDTDIGMQCFKPYDCPFFKYCSKNLPSPNVFDLGWRLSMNKKVDFYHSGIIKYEDLLKEKISDKVKTQIEYALSKKEDKIDKGFIKSFIDDLKYPLYFLDYESVQYAIPELDGTKPYQQLCFQYSLHILDESGNITHKEYLSSNYHGDFMRGLCEELIKDIPLNSYILAYNKSFEVSRTKEMASRYSDLSSHLLNIADNIKDLADIFSTQSYYNKDMGGSYSIKKVLPALFPNDSSLDYHNLDQVHKGDEASEAFINLKDMNEKDRNILRKNMLKYCELDTYAMVKIFEKLKEVI